MGRTSPESRRVCKRIKITGGLTPTSEQRGIGCATRRSGLSEDNSTVLQVAMLTRRPVSAFARMVRTISKIFQTCVAGGSMEDGEPGEGTRSESRP